MINAKNEFLNLVKNREVKCANIKYEPSGGYWPDEDSNLYSDQSKQILLKIGYSESDYQVFLDSLDFEYENGFGIQQLFGFVWFKDETWMERWEYDGSEGWRVVKMPDIPNECNPDSNIVNFSDFDRCVICGIETPYTIYTHIDYRIGYIEGAGQGCFKNCSGLTSRAYTS